MKEFDTKEFTADFIGMYGDWNKSWFSVSGLVTCKIL
jgi:hypothetical protein